MGAWDEAKNAVGCLVVGVVLMELYVHVLYSTVTATTTVLLLYCITPATSYTQAGSWLILGIISVGYASSTDPVMSIIIIVYESTSMYTVQALGPWYRATAGGSYQDISIS